jgi:cysteinyl-tRNA synthetase
MAKKHLGETIDIHAGGLDLVFPHHTNELAQSNCAHGGKQFARYWLHNGFLSINSAKMSKSVGNVLLVHDMVKTISGEIIRLALLSAHYRQPLDWSDDSLDAARRMLDRLYNALRGIEVSDELRAATEPPLAFIDALEDDLNTPKALAELFGLAKSLNKATDDMERQSLAAGLLAAGELMGLIQSDPEEWFASVADNELSAADIDTLLVEREEARSARDFSKADAIRDNLAEQGITIEDGAGGTRWRRSD